MTLTRLVGRLLAVGTLLLLTGCTALLDGPAARREALAEARFPPGGQFVELADGRRVHAVVAGHGPDLVLIHGASGNTRDFTFDFMQLLTDEYRTIVFDRPGLGYTDRSSDAYGGPYNTAAESPADQAAMLKEAADILGATDPIVLGHSYGAAVALAWALDYDPAALVVVSGSTYPWPGGELGLIYDLAAGSISGGTLAPVVTAFTGRNRITSVTEAIFAPQPVPDGYIDYIGAELTLRREAFLANARQVQGLFDAVSEMAPRYPDLDLPVEIVHGSADPVVPLHQHALRLVHDVPGARLTVLERVGHMPHHIYPEGVIASIDRAAARAGLR